MAKRSVFIGGGGPAGLAAALLFHQLGWEEIILAEARTGPQDFEKNRAFNYQIDARGQKLLKRLGIVDRMHDCGVENTEFTATTIKPDGSTSVATPPIIDPDRPPAFWSTRRMLLTMLYDAIVERNDGRITLHYDHTIEGVSETETGAEVTIKASDGSIKTFAPDVIVACDGMGSVLRGSVEALPSLPEGHFALTRHPSISSELQYKVLNLPAQFEAAGGAVQIVDNTMTYIIASKFTDSRRACALFSFPVTPNHPRTVNLIREKDHILWTFTKPEELIDYLVEAFPQVDMRALISMEEAQDFVDLKPGRFPIAQYTANLSVKLGETDFLLIGDAGHAFPPDLGLGVNSALEDLHILADYLIENPDHSAAIAGYEKQRPPESAALVRLVQTVFPEQYNTRPWAFRKWVAGFFARKALHPIVPGLVDKHAFLLSQDPEMDFVTMEQKKLRTDRNVARIGMGVVALAGLSALALFR